MTIPAGLRDWALARALNPHHPDRWAPDDVESFMAWKRDHVAARAQARIDDGTWALMNDDTRATWLRDDERMATAPPPSKVWTVCPCHSTPRQKAEDRTPVRHGLAWLTATFARR